MTAPFISNHQYNLIKKQAVIIKGSSKKGIDASVAKAVKDSAYAKIMALFPDADREQTDLLDIARAEDDAELDSIVEELQAYLVPFPELSEQKIKKLFPKSRKLKLPDLSRLGSDPMTYLGWNDIGTNKKYIVAEVEGRLAGVEFRFTMSSKHNVCSLCSTHGQSAFISAVTRARKSNNPDYYKAVGNYVCFDSEECNKKITDTQYLNDFILEILEDK
ncbi:FusB/FusC family EF-G-binding protein [Peribacillus sp. SCS-37]|uniref:FusB/FusC family EF-G-binding protein n=1 Tax=Paraperibacillus esterisolvens TaxID=3115296 RepID=UPI003906731F